MFKRFLVLFMSAMFSVSLLIAADEGDEKQSGEKKGATTISVTEVRVEEDASGQSKGIAEIVINGAIKVSDIKIDKSGAIKYPAFVSKSGREILQFNPVTQQAKDEIEKAIKTKKPSEGQSKTISYKITDFKAMPKSKSRKANVTVMFNNSVEVSCGVIDTAKSKKGAFVGWPREKDEETSKWKDQVKIINKKLKDAVDKTILAKYGEQKGGAGGGGGEEEE